MKRILKNIKPITVTSNFRGREVSFRYKSKQVFDMENEEEKALYNFWKKTYGFIIDDGIIGGD